MIINGDAFTELSKLSADSIDSLVTDPPAGISFMGKAWDHNKGGRNEWITWMESIMRECLRVMKPGAHGLVWAIPRTSHWTATALENAGFEVRDVVTHLFGSGFPKSLDISKAIDKAAGAKREVVGFSKGRSGGIHGGGQAVGADDPITAPATDSAKQWKGWGTALKPASEHWVLIRKPCSEKTVAANVLKHGVGGLNIDASRIGSETIKISSGKGFGDAGVYGTGINSVTANTSHTGRFPANLVFSHSDYCSDIQCDIECAIAMLDEQSVAGGMHGAGKPRVKKEEYNQKNSLYGIGHAAGNSPRLGDSDGASRFFFKARYSEDECKSHVSSVNESLSLKSLLEDFVQKLAAIEEVHEDKPLSGLIILFTNDIQRRLRSGVEPTTPLILSTVEEFLHELKHISSSSLSPASRVATQKLIGITTTTLSHLMLNGYAELATFSTTPQNLGLGAKDSVPNRFIYCAKISSSERNAGLEDMEAKPMGKHQSSLDGGKMLTGSGNHRSNLKQNTHPTVKPKKLMGYLIRMITPPNGTVLDPFMGSGSTGIAAKECGFKFIGIEKENDYFEIAEKRIGGSE